MENNLSASQLLAFQAISSFVSEANKVGGRTQKSLQLYNRLIEKTNISHKDAIAKHIAGFKQFIVANVDVGVDVVAFLVVFVTVVVAGEVLVVLLSFSLSC